MHLLLRFKHDCDTYPDSHIVTLESNERFFTDDVHKSIYELVSKDTVNASLMILDEDYAVLKYIRFDECIRTDGNLTVFLCNDIQDDTERLITLSIHNNAMDVPDCPSFMEIMTDNTTDNLCMFARGKRGYFELIV